MDGDTATSTAARRRMVTSRSGSRGRAIVAGGLVSGTAQPPQVEQEGDEGDAEDDARHLRARADVQEREAQPAEDEEDTRGEEERPPGPDVPASIGEERHHQEQRGEGAGEGGRRRAPP